MRTIPSRNTNYNQRRCNAVVIREVLEHVRREREALKAEREESTYKVCVEQREKIWNKPLVFTRLN